jgi:broad specificity phosphatase PhoE
MTASADGVRLLVVRHGQQERDGHDGPLTALGREQATDTAAGIRLAGNDRLVSSGLRRAVQTATALGRAPEQFGDLDEFRFGPQWTWAQADDHQNLALWRPEHRPRGGESLREFQARVEGALVALLNEPPAGELPPILRTPEVRWAAASRKDVVLCLPLTLSSSASALCGWP